MNKLKLFLGISVVGISVAITYHVFENVIHGAIDLIWYDWFDTDKNRILVIPLAVFLSFLYFGTQHHLDPKSEDHEESGLGQMPAPKFSKFLKVLMIGLLSLVAGASLGPEAILVPACMIVGAMVGVRLSKDKPVIKLLTAAGLMALFTAFFSSVLIGVLSVFLVVKQAKTKLSPLLLITALVASLASYTTLMLLDGDPFFELPHHDWKLNVTTLLYSLILVAAGWLMQQIMTHAHNFSEKVHDIISHKDWTIRALVASVGITVLYLLGGPLVEFTGNRSIQPLFNQAASLGLLGLLWILVIKISVISWSKSIGYRGGMIFPTIFLASVLIAIVQLYAKDFNMSYGLIAVLVGAFIADRKTHILV